MYQKEEEQNRSAPRAQESGAPPSHRSLASNPLTRFLTILGPGLITGAADDDPTGIATYAQAGAQAGYGLLWTTLLTLPMLATVQFMASKVALVRQQGLSGVIRDNFPRPIVYVAVLGLIVANVINAGADIGAMGAAVGLFVPVPPHLLTIPLGILILGFLIFGNYDLIQNTFKWLTLAFLGYIATSFLARPDLPAMFQGTLIPQISLSTGFLTLMVAVLGGNISPYLMFWQADMEVSEGAQARRQVRSASPIADRSLARKIKSVAWDTNVGMIFSNVIIYFIEVSSAETLFHAGRHNIATAAQAAAALRPLLGNEATILWAVGMLGAGVLAVPALTGSIADATGTLFGWGRGLNQKPDQAKRFYGVLAAATLIGLGINFSGISPIRALVVSAAINGFLTPPLLVLLILVANRRDVMGEHINGRGLNILAWGTTAIMIAAAIGLLYTML